MTQGLLVLGLAFKDYSHEWRMSVCYILGLAAVLAPLMVLFGLKFGVITGMVTALTEDPRNREVRPVGSGHYEADWFDTMRARPEISFVIPRTRTLAATVDLRSEQASNIVSAELLPSAGADPLLARTEQRPQGLNKVVLSASAAQRLQVAAGGHIEASIARRYQDRAERVQFKLTVVDVLNETAFSRPAVFSTLELVTAAESFRDGRAVPALGWSGTSPDAGGRSYPSFRLYARSIYDVPGLAQELTTAGQKVKTNAADIETVISIDRNLAIVFWIIALAGIVGFSLSLGASLWANIDRKRRDLSVLRVVGYAGTGIVLFPIYQAAFTACFGWLCAVLSYLALELVINHMLAPQLNVGQSICFLLPRHFAAALAIALSSALLAAILGGLRAARIEPSDGLREI